MPAYKAELDWMNKYGATLKDKAMHMQWESHLDDLKSASTDNGGPKFEGYGEDWGK